MFNSCLFFSLRRLGSPPDRQGNYLYYIDSQGHEQSMFVFQVTVEGDGVRSICTCGRFVLRKG